jgi:hypothetical protein
MLIIFIVNNLNQKRKKGAAKNATP